ncbi:phosphoglycerate kinase [Nonlabens dokdonensis]|uniref:Phosphoglycerate kinase n=2 Tax=Nonlabens dokdonensis TaxID=328515 RepID=L7W9N4_NONDD|nr:phosphoglycerate kinase [Nonlabens dokdonensis]AGC76556.1 phosphoglycerate kinase [Nonlabens dokdonensis DSW-6]PZX44207.1 phosphoglycerate kinase [Nonlabens dokdonensis]
MTIEQINFENKKALIRVDFNVPLDDDYNVTDATRIQAAKDTIIHVLEHGGSVILMSHLGRPKNSEEEFSLKHVCAKASDILGVQVKFVEDCIGAMAENAAAALESGEVLLLENLRYYKEETAGDAAFAKALSKLADVYINDAFGTAHREHASTAVIAQYFEEKCFGMLMNREIESLDKVMKTPERPLVAILGGAKVSSKITVIENILSKVDDLIIAGGMAYTFIKAQGGKIGDSLVEDDKQKLALEILEKAKETKTTIHLPVDVITASDFSELADRDVSAIDAIPDGWMGLDIGEESRTKFHQVLQNAKTILWNGPAGVFEMEPFSKGTIALGNSVAMATRNGAFSLVGGGDSVAAVKQFGFEDQVSYVSTGGGAMLEMLEGRTLPGIAAMNK